MAEVITRKEYLEMLRKADWSYMMSDDGTVYNRGASYMAKLQRIDRENPHIKGMLETYDDWWWTKNGKGRNAGEPEPFADEPDPKLPFGGTVNFEERN